MLKPSQKLILLQSSIDVAGNNEVGKNAENGNKINLSNLSVSKRSTRTSYLIFKSAKKGGNNSNSSSSNTKKVVKAAKRSDYLTLGTKKAFNLLWHAFIQALIL